MPSPTPIIVFDNLYNDQSLPVIGALVTCQLATPEGFSGGLVTGVAQSTTTVAAGYFQFSIIPNDLLSPANSYYVITIPSLSRSYAIAPQSINGSPQQTTAAGVIITAPSTLYPFIPSQVAGIFDLNQIATPPAPAAGRTRLYAKADGRVYRQTPAAIEWMISQLDPQAVAYAASIAPNLTLGRKVNVGTLTGDITINNPTNVPTDGNFVAFVLTQDGVGGHNVTWGSIFPNAPSVATGINASTYILFISDGTNLWSVSSAAQSSGVQSITAGTNITLGGTAANPIINAAEQGLLIPAHTPTAPYSTGIGNDPTYNFIAETVIRPGLSSGAQNPFTGQGGQIAFFAVTLPAGTTITHIGFWIGTTNVVFSSGGNGPNSWACLYDGNGLAWGVSTNITAAGGAAPGNWAGTQQLQVFNIDRFWANPSGSTTLATVANHAGGGWSSAGQTTFTVPAGQGGIWYIGVMVYLGSTVAGNTPTFAGIGNPGSPLFQGMRPAYIFNDTQTTYGAPTTAPAIAVYSNAGAGMIWGAVA